MHAVKDLIPLANTRLTVIDGASADAEFGADFGLHHAVHVTVQNGKFQCR